MTFFPFSDGFAFSQEEHGQVSQVKRPYILFWLFEARCLDSISLHLHKAACKPNQNKINGEIAKDKRDIARKFFFLSSDSVLRPRF